MKAKIWALVNLSITLSLIYWNYLSNTGFIDGKTIGSLSAKYDNLFVPAPYTFAIWGIIFLGLIVFSINAIRLAFANPLKDELSLKALPYLCFVNLMNGLWVWLWLKEAILLSVEEMVFKLDSLKNKVID